jgi:hypothetical protein
MHGSSSAQEKYLLPALHRLLGTWPVFVHQHHGFQSFHAAQIGALGNPQMALILPSDVMISVSTPQSGFGLMIIFLCGEHGFNQKKQKCVCNLPFRHRILYSSLDILLTFSTVFSFSFNSFPL